MRDVADFPSLLQSFFTTRLMTQRRVSPHTIASYRDTFRLLLQFAQKRVRKAPSQLSLEDLNASLIGAFLDDLETRRGNGARSRNLRLTAVRSFFRYAALEAPGHAGLIQRVLAIPNQRQPRAMVDFLTRPEIDALLAVPDRETWLGRAPGHMFIATGKGERNGVLRWPSQQSRYSRPGYANKAEKIPRLCFPARGAGG